MVYEGKNPNTGMPILKVFLNPLVNWIWILLVVTVMGTLLSLVPALQTARVAALAPVPAGEPLPGSATAGGD